MFRPECNLCGNQILEYQLKNEHTPETCSHCKREEELLLENHFNWEEDRVV